MRILKRKGSAYVCARLLAVALALLLFSPFAPAARAEVDGMIRVKLSRLGAPSAIAMQADCDYCLDSNPSARIPAGTVLTVSASGGKLVLSAGEKTAALGASFTLTRCLAGRHGMQFLNPALSNRFCGDLTFTVSGDVISTVLRIYVEDYLYGVVGCEMAPSAGLEALKAQAVAARNGALRQKAAHADAACDVMDTDAALTFKGFSDAAEYENVIRAVDDTRGGVLYYGDSPALCYTTDSNGGQIESAGNAFGTPLPYSAVADDPYDLASAAPKRTASIRKDAEDLPPELRDALTAGIAKQLNLDADAVDIQINAIERVTVADARYAAPSRVFKSLSFQVNATVDARGNAHTGSVTVTVPTYGGLETWCGLGINSENNETVWVSETGSTFEVTFRRSGHGVGLSQRGAQAMADEGKSCMEILEYYYPGTAVKRLSLADSTRDAGSGAARSGAEPIARARLSERASVYEHASEDSTALGALPAGATVDVYAVQDGWAAVSGGGRYGFVRSDALVPYDGDDPGETVVASADQYAQLTDDAGLYVNADDAVSPKEKLPKGTYVKLIAYNRSWALVYTRSGAQGYVKRDYLVGVQGAPNADPPAGAAQVDGGEITVVSGAQYLYVREDGLPMYRGYSVDSQVLARLSAGERVQVGAYNKKWACVRAGGVTGFVLVGGLTDQPPAEQSDTADGGEIATVSGKQYAAVVRDDAALVESWRDGAAEIGRLNEGDRVLVGAYNKKWACVRIEGVTGYMRIADLQPVSGPGDTDGGEICYVECGAVTTADVQMFDSADLDGAATAVLEQGTPLRVFAYNRRVAYVEADGRFGYVALRWLRRLT